MHTTVWNMTVVRDPGVRPPLPQPRGALWKACLEPGWPLLPVCLPPSSQARSRTKGCRTTALAFRQQQGPLRSSLRRPRRWRSLSEDTGTGELRHVHTECSETGSFHPRSPRDLTCKLAPMFQFTAPTSSSPSAPRLSSASIQATPSGPYLGLLLHSALSDGLETRGPSPRPGPPLPHFSQQFLGGISRVVLSDAVAI